MPLRKKTQEPRFRGGVVRGLRGAPLVTTKREKNFGTVSFADPIDGRIQIVKSTLRDNEWNVRRMQNPAVRWNGQLYQSPSQRVARCRTYEEALAAAQEYLAMRQKKATLMKTAAAVTSLTTPDA